MAKKIPLQNGMFAIVDDEDYERCMEYVWHINRKHEGSSVNIRANIKGKMTQLGTFIFNHQYEGLIKSHLNGDLFDYRKQNIKFIEKSFSRISRKGARGSSSRYKGVSRRKNNSWQANIRKDNKLIYLGTFASEDDAALAYNKAAIDLFGEGCYLNILGENNNSETHESAKVQQVRKKGTLGYKGVSKSKGRAKPFRARIWVEGKERSLGHFESKIEAARAYDKKARELFGDKAILNFPDEEVTHGKPQS